MDKKIVNLTGQEFNLCQEDGKIVKRIPSEHVPRIIYEPKIIGHIDGVPITKNFGHIERLPNAEEGKIFLVSPHIAKVCPDRDDLYIPSEPIRGAAGYIYGHRSISKLKDGIISE